MPHPDPAARVPAADPPGHAAHDRLLVAAHAAGDASGAELDRALALVATCAGCAALHHDLRAIAAALPATPAPRRSRDFRLTEEQASSLRPAGWRRLLVPLAGPRFAFAAPLGTGLAALGIAGLLLAGTGLPLGGASAGAAPVTAPLNAPVAGAAATAAPAGGDQSVGAAAASSALAGEGQGSTPTGSAGPVYGANAGPSTTPETDKNVAAATGAPSAAPVAAASQPAEVAPTGPDAGRTLGGDREATLSPAGNAAILVLAAVMLAFGVALAGLRVLSRRLA